MLQFRCGRSHGVFPDRDRLSRGRATEYSLRRRLVDNACGPEKRRNEKALLADLGVVVPTEASVSRERDFELRGFRG
jgi:hypothetical protein